VRTIESLHEAAGETALPAEDISAQTAQPAQPGGIRPERATRRRLSPEQRREVARLYAEGALPTSEIRKRFGIGKSSLYRIVQREGVPLRGRAAATPEPAPPRTQVPDSGRRGSSTPTGAQPPAVLGQVVVL
jgi:transposase-like protein